MNNQYKLQLLEIVNDPQQELPKRIRATKDIGLTGDSTMIDDLEKLFKRPRPSPEEMTRNWDPVAAERVVDLYIVEALYKLGNDSELSRIGTLVKQAGSILQGPDDELHNATLVILAIGRLETIQQLIELMAENNPQVVNNAVRTLNQLNLPQPPVGGVVGSVAHLSEKVTFVIQTLKEEMETLEKLSQGSLRLSPEVQEYIASNNYERGTVQRENVTLSEVVEHDLQVLGFDYFVEDDKVVICTPVEAGQRWQNWWQKYGKVLAYDKEQSRFVLKTQD